MAATQNVNATGSAKATIDHDEIREWVESHGGHPAMVKRTTRNGKGGILRIDFPGFSGEESLEEVSWDDFFEKSGRLTPRAAIGTPPAFDRVKSRKP